MYTCSVCGAVRFDGYTGERSSLRLLSMLLLLLLLLLLFHVTYRFSRACSSCSPEQAHDQPPEASSLSLTLTHELPMEKG